MAARVFALLLSISFGLALAGALMGPWLQGTPLEQFAPPSSVFNYQPSLSMPLVGDFIWAVTQMIEWFGKLPSLTAALLGTFSVPYPLNVLVLTAVAVTLAAFIIYIVSGRPVQV